MITDRNIAGAIVANNAAAASFPVVALTEITDPGGLLDQAEVATIWAAETVYALGSKVVPVVQNGLYFVLRQYAPGSDSESGSSEPSWPTYVGNQVLDSSLLWECVGKAPEALWDLRLAEHLVWKRKQGLAASLSDVALDARDQFKRSQVFDHISEMVAATAPFCVGSV
jgi:hypothetical protein